MVGRDYKYERCRTQLGRVSLISMDIWKSSPLLQLAIYIENGENRIYW
jgi:hypothetical protein